MVLISLTMTSAFSVVMSTTLNPYLALQRGTFKHLCAAFAAFVICRPEEPSIVTFTQPEYYPILKGHKSYIKLIRPLFSPTYPLFLSL